MIELPISALFSILYQEFRRHWPSRSELSLKRIPSDQIFLREQRDAWVLNGSFMALNPSSVEVRIRGVDLADLTLLNRIKGLPFDTHSVDLSEVEYEYRELDLLEEGKIIPATKRDGHREPRNNMQYSIRYLFERSDEFDSLAEGYDEMRMTIKFQLQGTKHFSESVTLGGPVITDWP